MSEDYSQLSEIAKSIRRKKIEMIFRTGSDHPGGSLAGVEIGTAIFFQYFSTILRILKTRNGTALSSRRDIQHLCSMPCFR